MGPRHPLVEDGPLYVTETGTGDDMVLTAPETGAVDISTPEGDATPVRAGGDEAAMGDAARGEEGAMPPTTRGDTGQTTAIAPDGTATGFATGFASHRDGIGPAGVPFAFTAESVAEVVTFIEERLAALERTYRGH